MPDTLPNAPEEPNSHRKHGDSLQCHFNSVVRISRAPGWRSFRGIDNRHNSLHRPDKIFGDLQKSLLLIKESEVFPGAIGLAEKALADDRQSPIAELRPERTSANPNGGL